MKLIFALTLFIPRGQALELAPVIYEASERYHLDPLLVVAVIYRESRFRRKVCYRGAYGLMQIQIKSKRCQTRLRGLYDPAVNINTGCALMAFWRDHKHKYHRDKPYHWLLHYNQGYGVCKRAGCSVTQRVPIRTGRVGGYARRVLKLYKALRHNVRNAMSS